MKCLAANCHSLVRNSTLNATVVVVVLVFVQVALLVAEFLRLEMITLSLAGILQALGGGKSRHAIQTVTC